MTQFTQDNGFSYINSPKTFLLQICFTTNYRVFEAYFETAIQYNGFRKIKESLKFLIIGEILI